MTSFIVLGTIVLLLYLFIRLCATAARVVVGRALSALPATGDAVPGEIREPGVPNRRR